MPALSVMPSKFIFISFVARFLLPPDFSIVIFFSVYWLSQQARALRLSISPSNNIHSGRFLDTCRFLSPWGASRVFQYSSSEYVLYLWTDGSAGRSPWLLQRVKTRDWSNTLSSIPFSYFLLLENIWATLSSDFECSEQTHICVKQSL